MGAKHSAKMGGRLSAVRGCATNVNQIPPPKKNKPTEKGVAATKFVVFIQDVDTGDDDIVGVDSAVPRPNKPKKKHRSKTHDPETDTIKNHENPHPRITRANSASAYDTDNISTVDDTSQKATNGNKQKVERIKKV